MQSPRHCTSGYEGVSVFKQSKSPRKAKVTAFLLFLITLITFIVCFTTGRQTHAQSQSSPYSGTPISLPGTFQVEDFDHGGEGIAYHDTSPGNIAASHLAGDAARYRQTDVDLYTFSNGETIAAWFFTDEWLNYTVNVATTGTYTLEARLASADPNGAFRVEVDGVDVTGSMTVPNTGDWWSGYQTVTMKTGVQMSAGTHTLRIVASGAHAGNLDWLRFTETDSAEYSVVNDYSDTSNPIGMWSYGYQVTPNGSFVPYTARNTVSGGLSRRYREDSTGTPSVIYNNQGSTQSYPTVVHPADLLNLHPGPNGERSVARWTAPADGRYLVEGRFQGIDTGGTTTDGIIAHNNELVLKTPVTGYNTSRPFSFEIDVASGGWIDFIVDYGGNANYEYDSTGLAATITRQADPIPPTSTPPHQLAATAGNNEVRLTSNESFYNGRVTYKVKRSLPKEGEPDKPAIFQTLTSFTAGAGNFAYTDTTTINGQKYFYQVTEQICTTTASQGRYCYDKPYTNQVSAISTTDSSVALEPRTYLNTDYVEPSGGEVTFDITDNAEINGQRLQEKLNTILPGQKLVVKALTPTNMPAIYQAPRGGFLVPKKNNGAAIYVVTDRYANLPAPGRRVIETDMSKMPTLHGVRSGESVLKFAAGASNWRFIGINVDIDSSVAVRLSGQQIQNPVIDMGIDAVNLDEFPSNNVFDRCNLHSHNNCEVRRIVWMGGRNNAVIDSRVYEGTHSGEDAQAILVANGSGPHKIVNNYLNGSGEIVFLGGDDPKLKGIVAMDVEIRRNYFFKPDTDDWRSKSTGGIWIIKNHLESKASARVLVEGNVFQNSRVGDGGQGGQAVVLKSTHNGTDPSQLTSDWTLRYNKFDNCSAGYALTAVQSNHPDGTPNPDGYTNQGTKRIHIHDNLFTKFAALPGRKWLLDLHSLLDNQPYSHKQLRDIRIEHETAVHVNETSGATSVLGDRENGLYQRTRNFIFRDNIVGAGQYGIIGDNVHGTNALREYTPGYETNVVNNVIIRMPTHNHPESVTILSAMPKVPPSTAAVGFENYTAEEFRLRADSPYKGKATDGRDPGADIAGVNQRTAGAISGVWQ